MFSRIRKGGFKMHSGVNSLAARRARAAKSRSYRKRGPY